MPKKRTFNKRRSAKNTLRLPDLDHSKTSVLQSLSSAASKRTYAFAINDFIAWYCSEPRLAFGRTVVLRYRYELEARRLAPATINLRLAAVRRLAYKAADNGLLSPDLAASVRRVKGAKKLGTRLGNWLTCAQGRRLLDAPNRAETKGKRGHAILAILLGCGLRRAELISLKLAHLQQRDDHWAIVDLFGKGGHVRTVPVPGWVKAAVDEWLAVACIEDGLIFRCVTHSGTVWVRVLARRWSGGSCAMLPKRLPSRRWLPMTCAVHVLGCAIQPVESLSRFSSYWDIVRWRRRRSILARGSGSCRLSMTSWALSPMPRRYKEVTANKTFQAPRLLLLDSTRSGLCGISIGAFRGIFGKTNQMVFPWLLSGWLSCETLLRSRMSMCKVG
jgi:integrase